MGDQACLEKIRHFFIDSFCCQCGSSFRLHPCRNVFFLQPGGQHFSQSDFTQLFSHTACNHIRYKGTNQVYALRHPDRRIIISFSHRCIQRPLRPRRHLASQPFIRGFSAATDCLACDLQTFTDNISNRIFSIRQSVDDLIRPLAATDKNILNSCDSRQPHTAELI